MDEKSLLLIKSMVDATISNYFWWFVVAGMAMFCKNIIESMVAGMTFYLGRDYNVDDEVYLFGNKKARIVRQTISKTTFYIYDGNRKLIVQNNALPNMQIETVLRTDAKE